MKVLFLTKYGAKAASTRYRYLQYIPYLSNADIECVLSPLLSDNYLNKKFSSGRAPLMIVASGFLQRTWSVLNAGKFDAVVVHYEVFPYLPPLFERLMKRRGIPFFYDFDDAIFHQYDSHKIPFVRWLLGNKIAKVISLSSGVIAGNEYLAQYARQNNPHVEIFPTVVDVSAYSKKGDEGSGHPFTIGWIGSPSTYPYVKQIAPVLRQFCDSTESRVVLIGSGPAELPGVPVQVKEWTEKAELEELREFDIGIMPLPDEPWTRGKCGFKLIQYMAAGLPVIASPVGINRDIVEEGVNGFLAHGEKEWLSALNTLYGSLAKRREMGKRGLKKVTQHYDVKVFAPKLIDLLKGVSSC